MELRTHFEVAVRIPTVPDSEPTRTLAGDIRRLNAMLVGLLRRYGARPG